MLYKKYFLTLILTCSLGYSNAQQLQNPSFDSVYYGGIDRVWNWITSDAAFMGGNVNGDTLGPQQTNYLFGMGQGHEVFGHIDIYNSSPYSSIGIKLNTTQYKKNNGKAFETYIVNGEHYYTDSSGYIDFSKCGSPFSYRPDSLKGFYQYIDSNLTTTDYGLCITVLTKYNISLGKRDTIAYNVDSLSFEASPWRVFSIPINYVSADQPDSLTVIFKASTSPFEGSSFWLDNLEFVYGPTATNNFSSNKKFPVVYPNPSSGILYINENGVQLDHYRILDMYGRLIENRKFENELILPQSSLGIMFLELYNLTGLIKTYKVICK